MHEALRSILFPEILWPDRRRQTLPNTYLNCATGRLSVPLTLLYNFIIYVQCTQCTLNRISIHLHEIFLLYYHAKVQCHEICPHFVPYIFSFANGFIFAKFTHFRMYEYKTMSIQTFVNSFRICVFHWPIAVQDIAESNLDFAMKSRHSL